MQKGANMLHDKSNTGTPAHAPQAAPTTILDALARVKGKKFIVVEKDLQLAQTMSEWLAIMGCHVESFGNAEEALMHTNVQYADYYIVDQASGARISGSQLLNLLRLKRGKPICAVLINSDEPSEASRSAARPEWPQHCPPINMPGLISSLIDQMPEE